MLEDAGIAALVTAGGAGGAAAGDGGRALIVLRARAERDFKDRGTARLQDGRQDETAGGKRWPM